MTDHQRKIKSYCRHGRLTARQSDALVQQWPRYGLEAGLSPVGLRAAFPADQPCLLDIGFGDGQALIAQALARPDSNFIGVDVHLPGVGSVLSALAAHQLRHVRLFKEDVVAVLSQSVPQNYLSGVQIYFPDPWPKKRHHKRRLIQREFVQLLVSRMQPGALLHCATDWDHYAVHMQDVFSQIVELAPLAEQEAAVHPMFHRREKTKFQSRGERLGHQITELWYQKAMR